MVNNVEGKVSPSLNVLQVRVWLQEDGEMLCSPMQMCVLPVSLQLYASHTGAIAIPWTVCLYTAHPLKTFIFLII